MWPRDWTAAPYAPKIFAGVMRTFGASFEGAAAVNDGTSQFDPASASRFSRPQAIRDICIVGSPIVLLGIVGNLIGLDTFSGVAIVNLGYVLMIILGGLLLGIQGSSWREIGLARPNSPLRTLLYGVMTFVGAVAVFVIMQIIAMYLFTALGLIPAEIDQSRFNAMEGDLLFFVLAIILAWTTIAFGEEMFFRAFLITRLIDFTTIKAAPAVLIAGAIFGAVHFAEGPIGILSNGAFGVLFGWIFLRSGRNLWITIIAHGFINTLRFLLLYSGAA